MEIICIDDGSTDNAGKILDEYARKDKRIIPLHQKNRGESNARNVGLHIAQGDYIGFMDCDDWIDADMYQVLVDFIEKYDLDMVASSWYKETQDNSEKIENQLPVKQDTFGRTELLKYIYKRDYYRGFAYIWDKLYKREILYRENRELVLFDESLRLGGDVLYLAEIALSTKKARYINRAFYHYNQRNNSGCHTKDVSKLREWLKAYEMIIKKFQTENVDREIIEYVKRFLAYHSSNAVEIALEQENNAAKRDFQLFMRLYEKEYISLNQEYPDRVQRYIHLLNS